MKISIRHLSGSRSGAVDVFEDAREITIGRNPVNMVSFDPDTDRLVSGSHAKIVADNGSLVLRDVGSSNGTWIDGASVTERTLRPGQIVELGKGGPRLQIEFAAAAADVPGTVVLPLDSVQEAPVPEGRTVMMMLNPSQPAAGAAPLPPTSAVPAYSVPTARKKKGGIGRALAIVGGIVVVLLVLGVALAFVVRSANVKKREAARKEKPQTVATSTAESTTDAPAAAVDTSQLAVQIQQAQQATAQTQEALNRAQQASGGPSSAAEVADLQRQLMESQRQVEMLMQQLQQKNDQISNAPARPQPVQPTFMPPTRTPARTSPPSQPTAVAGGPASSQPAAQPSQPPAATTVSNRAPARNTPSNAPTQEPAPVAAAQEPAAPVYPGKQLKKRVLITPLPSEVPPANMPAGTPRDLATLLGSALASTGDFVIGAKGQASVSVMVTDYRSEQQGGVDVKKSADNARKLGKLFGADVPKNPVDVRSKGYDAAMAARLRVFDSTGRLVTETETSAEASDRKSKVALSGVSFHDVAMSNTATGDAARKVIGDAVESIHNGLMKLDWSTTISGQTTNAVTIAAGRNSDIEPGDVFDIVDGQRTVGRIRVTIANETTSNAEFVGAVVPKVKGKMVRFVGSETPPRETSGEKSLVIKKKTQVYDGPGESFRAIKELRPGARLKFHFIVGPWARASEGGSSFWVPLQNAQVTN